MPSAEVYWHRVQKGNVVLSRDEINVIGQVDRPPALSLRFSDCRLPDCRVPALPLACLPVMCVWSARGVGRAVVGPLVAAPSARAALHQVRAPATTTAIAMAQAGTTAGHA